MKNMTTINTKAAEVIANEDMEQVTGGTGFDFQKVAKGSVDKTGHFDKTGLEKTLRLTAI